MELLPPKTQTWISKAHVRTQCAACQVTKVCSLPSRPAQKPPGPLLRREGCIRGGVGLRARGGCFAGLCRFFQRLVKGLVEPRESLIQDPSIFCQLDTQSMGGEFGSIFLSKSPDKAYTPMNVPAARKGGCTCL